MIIADIEESNRTSYKMKSSYQYDKLYGKDQIRRSTLLIQTSRASIDVLLGFHTAHSWNDITYAIVELRLLEYKNQNVTICH